MPDVGALLREPARRFAHAEAIPDLLPIQPKLTVSCCDAIARPHRAPISEGACVICLGVCPPPIHSGCACHAEQALAHLHCRIHVQAAASQAAHRASVAWRRCPTCKQDFTGPMRSVLVDAWRTRVVAQAKDSATRFAAEADFVRAPLVPYLESVPISWAHPCHICTGTDLNSLNPLPHCAKTDWAHPCHVCTGTGSRRSVDAATPHAAGRLPYAPRGLRRG
jgi:hypothetical protein